MREIKLHAVYLHFKGNLYYVEDEAIDSETGELNVVYRALYGERKLYVRPKAMFLSEVDRKKYPEVTAKYRFELVD